MTRLRILTYPDQGLKRTAVKVETFNDEIQKVIDDMFETHYHTPNCAALAATQLDLPVAWAITVIDFSENKDQPLCLVNPEIIYREGTQESHEGCMSVYPEYVHAKVKRAQKIIVKAQDRHGTPFEMTAEDFMAKCIQHEVDHLNGMVYLERLSKLKQDALKKKIQKAKKTLKIIKPDEP